MRTKESLLAPKLSSQVERPRASSSVKELAELAQAEKEATPEQVRTTATVQQSATVALSSTHEMQTVSETQTEVIQRPDGTQRVRVRRGPVLSRYLSLGRSLSALRSRLAQMEARLAAAQGAQKYVESGSGGIEIDALSTTVAAMRTEYAAALAELTRLQAMIKDLE